MECGCIEPEDGATSFISTSFSALYAQKSSRNRNAPAKLQVATIHVYDVSKALPVNKKLAEEYIIDSDNVVGKCRTATL